MEKQAESNDDTLVELKKYRAALEKISTWGLRLCHGCQDMRLIASEALNA